MSEVSTPVVVPPVVEAVNSSTTLVIGPTGTGKSSLAATLAEYVWETHRKVTDMYICDGGGLPSQVQALVNLGIMRFWRMRSRSAEHLVPETLHRASLGWWPRTINPRTGETSPNVDLIPPITSTITMSCPEGHLAQTVRFEAQLRAGICPICKKPVNPTNWALARSSKITKGFETRGAVFNDGMTSGCSWLLDDLSRRGLGGEGTRLGGTVESGSMRFGENNRSQFGFAQNRAEQWILNGGSIPGLVVPPVWTALLKEGEMEGLRIKGPDVAGSAKTAVAPQWAGNCIETAIVEVEGKKYRRLYLDGYIDNEGFRHLLKVRTYPGYLPAYLEDLDMPDTTADQRFVNFNLGLLHKLLDNARAQYEAVAAVRHPDAPGVSDSFTVGEEEAPVPVTAPVVAGALGTTAGVSSTPAAPTLSPAERARQRAAAKTPAPASPPPTAPPTQTADATPAAPSVAASGPAVVRPPAPSPPRPVAARVATPPGRKPPTP